MTSSPQSARGRAGVSRANSRAWSAAAATTAAAKARDARVAAAGPSSLLPRPLETDHPLVTRMSPAAHVDGVPGQAGALAGQVAEPVMERIVVAVARDAAPFVHEAVLDGQAPGLEERGIEAAARTDAAGQLAQGGADLRHRQVGEDGLRERVIEGDAEA